MVGGRVIEDAGNAHQFLGPVLDLVAQHGSETTGVFRSDALPQGALDCRPEDEHRVQGVAAEGVARALPVPALITLHVAQQRRFLLVGIRQLLGDKDLARWQERAIHTGCP